MSVNMGYLPNDTPSVGRLLLFGMQHVLTMFPATVLVALLCGFHVGTVLLASGLATIVALTLSRYALGTFIPLYYGSSFSYIASYLSISKAITGTDVKFGTPAPNEVIEIMQAGIIATGILNIAIGFLIKAVGKPTFDKILPPIVTGPVACVIGFALSYAALDMSIRDGYWPIALLTLVATIACSHLLQGRGLIGMLPVLFGAAVGYLVTLAAAPSQIAFANVASEPMFVIPHITAPNFSGPLVLTAVFSISIMAIATIPESTAHLYQMSLYVDNLADEQKRPKVVLDRYIGYNLVFDGVGDVICGVCGGPAGTNYGENNSLMAITRNYSGPALVAAAVICIVLAFVGKFAALIATIPVFVTGGLALYLFGVIGMQGIALMHLGKVKLFDPLQLGVGATIMVIGIGGNIGYPGGFLPIVIPGIFPNGLPAIATAAVVGTVLHLVFSALRRPDGSHGPIQVPTVTVADPTTEQTGL